MSRSSKSFLSVSALVLSSSVLFVGSPALAAEGDVVCDYWATGDVYNVHAVQTGERGYQVHIMDANIISFESSAADEYVPLPLEPNLRLSINEVEIDPRVSVSSVQGSQSIQSGPPEPGAPIDWAIDSYLGNPLAPWESVTETADGITWLQDIDAYTDSNGVQAKPSDFPPFFPAAAIDASAGVLSFTVSIPDDVGGVVPIFEQMTASFTSSMINTSTNEITADQNITEVIPGCSIEIEATTDPGENETPEGEGTPEGEVKAPTPAKRVETAALGA